MSKRESFDAVIKLAYENNLDDVRDIVRLAMESQYKTIADAATVTGDKRYAGRGVEVWYMKKLLFRDLSGGKRFLEKYEPHMLAQSKEDLSKTHVLLGEVGGHSMDDVWDMMQGMHWSPSGEARSLIQKKGLGHTSMSVGDILGFQGSYYMVGNVGFDKLF